MTEIDEILRDIGTGPANSPRENAFLLAGMSYISDACAKGMMNSYRELQPLVHIAEAVRPQLPQLADMLIEMYQKVSRDFDRAADAMNATGEKARAQAKRAIWGAR